MPPLARLALIYDLRPATHQVNDPPDLYAEFESMEHLEELHSVLESLGFAVSLVDAHADVIQRLMDLKPSIDLVFNYSVGIHGRSREVRLPALCELLDIPFIGSDPMAHAIGSNKHFLKCLAVHLEIATPRWMCLDPSTPITVPQAAKVIVKPCCEGSSIGVTGPIIVTDSPAIATAVTRVWETYAGSAVIEEFIEGYDVTVPLVGRVLRALPPVLLSVAGQVVSGDLTYTADLKVASRQEWLSLGEYVPESESVQATALLIANAIGCRDFARVDFRVTPDGKPFLLEVNTTPNLDVARGAFACAARIGGSSFERVLAEIVVGASMRGHHSKNHRSAI